VDQLRSMVVAAAPSVCAFEEAQPTADDCYTILSFI